MILEAERPADELLEPGDQPAGTRRPGIAIRLERRVSFLLPLAASLPVAWVLVLHYHSIYADALSRLANAYYVLYSRDPHLAAIGFVWNPLPSLADMPLLLFKGLWPALSRQAFASNLMSCLFYALCCHQLYRFLEELGLRRWFRWSLWLCFAANPLVFYFGANGMSEALFLWTLVVAARYFARWLEGGSSRDLTVTGFALGVAYLARNEAAAATAAGTVVVVLAGLWRTKGKGPVRRRAIGTDVFLFASPSALSFAVWALISWVIVGQPFEQFSGQNGNAELIKLSGSTLIQSTVQARLSYALSATFSVAPLLVVVVVLALIKSLRSRDLRSWAPISIISSVLVFEILAYANHQIFPWYRYYIYACPAIVMTAGCLLAPPSHRSMAGAAARLRQGLMGLLALAMVLPGFYTTAQTFGTEGSAAASDRYQLAYILWPRAKDANFSVPRGYEGLIGLARYLDSLKTSHGGIMVDNADTCIPQLLLLSDHPKEFAIPNDQDYQEKFGVPYEFGVRYFLVPDPAQEPIDELDTHLPGLYLNGQGLATLVKTITVTSCPTFRLYKVLPISN